jgi:hypothetical protein
MTIDVTLEDVALPHLRECYRELFDLADRDVQRAGLDQDDVELWRSLVCRIDDGAERTVRVAFISDETVFRAEVRRNLGGDSGQSCQGLVTVLAAQVDIVHDRWRWYGG